MARRPNINACVFCEPDPCTCGVKPKKAAAPRPRKAEPEPAPKVEAEPPRPSVREAMRGAAQAAQLERKKVLPTAPVRAAGQMSSEDALTLQALRVLQDTFGEIDGPDLAKYKDALSRPATTAERALAWKERRRLE